MRLNIFVFVSVQIVVMTVVLSEQRCATIAARATNECISATPAVDRPRAWTEESTARGPSGRREERAQRAEPAEGRRVQAASKSS